MGIFESKPLRDLMDYRWETFGHKLHYIGAFFHFLYVIIITVYVNDTFFVGRYGSKGNSVFSILLIIGIIWPFSYDTLQLIKQGPIEYFSDSWNWTDFGFQWASIINIVFQFTLDKPSNDLSVVSMSIVIFMAIWKTMFFLRIFDDYAYLVELLKTVMIDLKYFLIFYLILIFFFTLILGVIGYQNKSGVGVAGVQADGLLDGAAIMEMIEEGEVSGKEYLMLGRFFAAFVTVFRMSMGDNDFEGTDHLTSNVNWVFWLIWVILTFMTSIIFFNFIIAEACESYNRVMGDISNILMHQRALLNNETEDMLPASWKRKTVYSNVNGAIQSEVIEDPTIFPKYLITRQMEE